MFDRYPALAVNQEGRVLRSWGKGMYTVPHSIRVDPEGNIWDVAWKRGSTVAPDGRLTWTEGA